MKSHNLIELICRRFLVDAPQALDASVHLNDRDLRVAKLRLIVPSAVESGPRPPGARST
jgi:hypothetical protein